MINIEETSFDKAQKIHNKLFFIGFCGENFESKLMILSLTCYVTSKLRKKNKDISCYDVLLKLGNDSPDIVKNTSFKALACVCEDLMYGCEEFSTFGIESKNVAQILKNQLSKISPF